MRHNRAAAVRFGGGSAKAAKWSALVTLCESFAIFAVKSFFASMTTHQWKAPRA